MLRQAALEQLRGQGRRGGELEQAGPRYPRTIRASFASRLFPAHPAHACDRALQCPKSIHEPAPVYMALAATAVAMIAAGLTEPFQSCTPCRPSEIADGSHPHSLLAKPQSHRMTTSRLADACGLSLTPQFYVSTQRKHTTLSIENGLMHT